MRTRGGIRRPTISRDALCAALLVLSSVLSIASSMAVAEQYDFAATSIVHDPHIVLPGSIATITVVVANQGDVTPTEPVAIRLTINGQVVAEKSIGAGLHPGGEEVASFYWAFTRGTHRIGATVDCYNIVEEADESNNRIETQLKVGLRLFDVTPGIPDSSAYAVSWFEDFEGSEESWHPSGWVVAQSDTSTALACMGEGWGELPDVAVGNTAFQADLRLLSGEITVDFAGDGGGLLGVVFSPEEPVVLCRESEDGTRQVLASSDEVFPRARWMTVTVLERTLSIDFLLDGEMVFSHSLPLDEPSDSTPVDMSRWAIRSEEGAGAWMDNVWLFDSSPVRQLSWESCGGPFGGLGYDIAFDPRNPEIMYATNATSGLFKSFDGGETWIPKSAGILSTATENDVVSLPIFCVTVDPHRPDTLWVGTLNGTGVYKSTDGGETWAVMNNGIQEPIERLSIRGFTVHPEVSDIVFMQAGVVIDEKSRWSNLEMNSGVVYRTTDGGQKWVRVWQGHSLTRILRINPHDPDIVYASTGIFDRWAANDWGVGVLKSIDGGTTWTTANDGLRCLYVSFLEMHPGDPDTLLAAAGNGDLHGLEIEGGVFKTTDGGQHWREVLTERCGYFSSIAFAPSDPLIVYTGTSHGIYRSMDGGETWVQLSKPDEPGYGPPGVRPGNPISLVVHPADPMTLFVNGYQGGVFKSTDGAKSWTNWSAGYTGVEAHDLSLGGSEAPSLYAACSGGLFRTDDGGIHWEGLGRPPATHSHFAAVEACPADPDRVLAVGLDHTVLYLSQDHGDTWVAVLEPPSTLPGWHHMESIAFSVSDPDVIYAGYVAEAAASASYGMIKSTDGGQSWKEINAGLERTTRNMCCVAVHPEDPDVVYAGTLHDGVFRSMDGGASWSPCSQGLRSAHVASLAIDPLFPETIYAGLADGVGVFLSTDGGDSWQEINMGLSVECPSYLARVGEVRLGLSLDRQPSLAQYQSAPNWSTISAMAIDPTDNLRVYLADVASGVFFSENGGPWLPLRQGLDALAVDDLVISEDGKALYAAVRGRGVYRLHLP